LQLETKLDDLNDSIKKFEHEIMSVNGQLSEQNILLNEQIRITNDNKIQNQTRINELLNKNTRLENEIIMINDQNQQTIIKLKEKRK